MTRRARLGVGLAFHTDRWQSVSSEIMDDRSTVLLAVSVYQIFQQFPKHESHDKLIESTSTGLYYLCPVWVEIKRVRYSNRSRLDNVLLPYGVTPAPIRRKHNPAEEKRRPARGVCELFPWFIFNTRQVFVRMS